MFFFFFFQAEDGIRDYKVTGVQTCALPISGGDAGVRLLHKPAGSRLAAAVRPAAARGVAGAGANGPCVVRAADGGCVSDRSKRLGSIGRDYGGVWINPARKTPTVPAARAGGRGFCPPPE